MPGKISSERALAMNYRKLAKAQTHTHTDKQTGRAILVHYSSELYQVDKVLNINSSDGKQRRRRIPSLALMECLPCGIKGDSVEFIMRFYCFPRVYTEYIFKD